MPADLAVRQDVDWVGLEPNRSRRCHLGKVARASHRVLDAAAVAAPDGSGTRLLQRATFRDVRLEWYARGRWPFIAGYGVT